MKNYGTAEQIPKNREFKRIHRTVRNAKNRFLQEEIIGLMLVDFVLMCTWGLSSAI